MPRWPSTGALARRASGQSQFLSRMSHELRTPLNAVLGFTQLLQIEASRAGQEEHLAKLEHIRAAGDHLLSLINDVLDLSALESGELRLSLRPVELGELVHQSLPLLHSLAAQHGVALATGKAEGTARADPTRLRQVLINLVSNAIKYNRRGGQVLVETIADEGETMLVVPRHRSRPQRGPSTTCSSPSTASASRAKASMGTGIGLTIVRALVDGMNGADQVSSELGEGTAFTVRRRPRARQHNGERCRARTGGGGARPGQGTILYIEDNAVNVLLVEELVPRRRAAWSSSRAAGAGGVAEPPPWQPDLILVACSFRISTATRCCAAAGRSADARDALRGPRPTPCPRTCAAASLPALPTTGPSRSTSPSSWRH